MPFRRNRDTHHSDREIHRLYGEDAHGTFAENGRGDFAGHDPEDDREWAFGDELFDQEHRSRGAVRRTLGCLIPLVLLAGVGGAGYLAYQHVLDNWGSPSCKFVANGYDYQWAPDQARSASTIVMVGVDKKGVPARAAVVAATTAIQESKLRNLQYGDLDSLGLFQQRASQGWGTTAQILDPVYASSSFYNALLKVDGWQSMSIGAAAQAVQRSGFPDAYAEHQTQGEVIAAVMTGTAHEGIACRLDPAKANGSPTQIVQQLSDESGLTAQAGTGTVTYRGQSVDGAQAVAAWAIAHANDDNITAVTVGNRTWERHRGRDGWKWHPAKQPTGSPTLMRVDVETGK
ncbi:hypothetical protein [Flexivirga caeni]|uniref:Uncharacterized protein n=1 Tax=Flexivirga caeni TaxID=2294115 RepID=A0A3M9M1Z2_9MICO|nr:hypothetical protein [Flexivirga caeni]RNI19482.1 hypothetical protein EFY87_16745 [Flexivirga caeni]